MKLKYINTHKTCLAILLTAMLFSSCKKYVDIDIAPNQLGVNNAFNGDGTATSAILTLYSDAFITSGMQYWATLGGLEADELQYSTTGTNIGIREFQTTNISPANTANSDNIWNNSYGLIGQTNLAIGGITNSTQLTPAVKNQLLGEAKFFRAYAFFNLVNYYGDVPLTLDAEALKNAYLPRSASSAVWAQIITDLKDAQNLMPSAYTITGTVNAKTRANKYTATALLARAYLYTKDYINAEAEASKIISATDITYTLPTINDAFLNTSSEVIFQIATTTANNRPILGYNYNTLKAYSLIPGFVTNVFEAGDARATSWVTGGSTITKYKLAGNEYNVIFRLAEQFLIRSEARAQLGTNLSGAIGDLNAVRLRANLPGTTATTTATLLPAIAKERRAELFGEGHRWFDLIRTGTANSVIGALKPTSWKTTAIYAPIPSIEITKNSSLTQNPGYPN